jgi:hypothetical protein
LVQASLKMLDDGASYDDVRKRYCLANGTASTSAARRRARV